VMNPLACIFFLMLLFSIIPLPQFIFKIISSNTHSIYREYLSNGAGFVFPLRSLSLYSYKTTLSIIVLFAYGAVFYSFVNRFDGFRVRTRLANLVVFTVTFIAFLGIINMYVQNNKLFWCRPIISGTPTGPFINTIHFSHFMALGIPIAIAMWIGKIRLKIKSVNFNKITFLMYYIKYSILYFVPAVIMTAALFRALSRGAMIAFCVSILFFMVLLILKKRIGKNLLLLLAIMLIAVIFINRLDKGTIGARIETLKSPMQTQSGQMRLAIWGDTLKIVKDYPLFGIGLNTYQGIIQKYKTIYGSGKMVFTHAENDYIETLSEVGIFGMTIIILMGLFFTRNVFIHFKLSRDSFETILLVGGISSCIAALIGACTDFVFHIPAISFIFLVVCFIIWPRDKRERRMTLSYHSNQKGFMFLIYGMFLISLLLLIFSARLLAGQLFYYKFIQAPDSFNFRIYYMKRAINFDGKNANYRYRLGETYFEEAKLIREIQEEQAIYLTKKAKMNFDKAIELEPTNWKYHFYSGSTEFILAVNDPAAYSVAEAEKSFDRAVQLNPTEYDIYSYLGDYYLDKDPSRAFGYYRKLIELRPWTFISVLDTIWKRSTNPYLIRNAIPDDAHSCMRYAYYLESKGIDAGSFYEEVVVISEKSDMQVKLLMAEEFEKRDMFREASDCIISAIEATYYFSRNKDEFLITQKSAQELIKDEEDINKYREPEWRDADALSKFALFYYRIEEYNKAIGYFEKLLKIKPASSEIQFRLALTLRQDGKYENAFEMLKKVYRRVNDGDM